MNYEKLKYHKETTTKSWIIDNLVTDLFVYTTFFDKNILNNNYNQKIKSGKKYLETAKKICQKENSKFLKELYSKQIESIEKILDNPILITINQEHEIYLGNNKEILFKEKYKITPQKINLFEKNIFQNTNEKNNLFGILNEKNMNIEERFGVNIETTFKYNFACAIETYYDESGLMNKKDEIYTLVR